MAHQPFWPWLMARESVTLSAGSSKERELNEWEDDISERIDDPQNAKIPFTNFV
jgi:hypothetical protein